MERKINYLFLLFAFIILFLQGCAFGNREVSLNYTPIVQIEKQENVKIAIIKFTDERNQSVLGEMRNGMGMKTADVVANQQDVGAWIANALASELQQSNYDVEKYADLAPSDIKIVITGKVLEAYVKAFMTFQTTIRANIVMEKNGIPVINKEYIGKASGLNIVGSVSEYESQLDKALQDMMKQIVPDIAAQI